jgi:NitT/TauT family transport system substrate-binding protein
MKLIKTPTLIGVLNHIRSFRFKSLERIVIFPILVFSMAFAPACQTTTPQPGEQQPAAQPTEPGEPTPPQIQTTHIRFTLDFVISATQVVFLVASYNGYFAEENLSVVLDRGYGSADAVSKVASGAYNMGFADISSMIEFNANNPNEALVAVAHVMAPPSSILTLEGRGIESIRDIEGKTLGGPAGDAARRLFPVFANVVGIDADSINWVSMDPPLREPMLIQGEVDAISGFTTSAMMNLIAAGVDEEDIIIFLYTDHGLDLYGNAVVVPPSLLEENPEAIRGFLRALTRAWHFTIENPDEAIEILQRREPLVNPEVERARLQHIMDRYWLTPEVLENGFGYVSPERLQMSIDLLTEAFELPKELSPDEVYNGTFLPPQEDRMPRN